MFSGIIEEIGKIVTIKKQNDIVQFVICAHTILDDLHIDDSVAVNGVCQTVVNVNKRLFKVEAIKETMDKSNFSQLKVNDLVNLERALSNDKRNGGHNISGHVQTTGIVKSIEKRGENYLFGISCPKDIHKYNIKEGSIAVDGVSLTIADMDAEHVYLSIIPHTWKSTLFKYYSIGHSVNLEADIMAKMIFEFLRKIKSN